MLTEPCSALSHGPARCRVQGSLLRQRSRHAQPRVVCLHLDVCFSVSYCHLLNWALMSLSQKENSWCTQFPAWCFDCCWKGIPQSAQTSPIKPKPGAQKGLGLSVLTHTGLDLGCSSSRQIYFSCPAFLGACGLPRILSSCAQPRDQAAFV